MSKLLFDERVNNGFLGGFVCCCVRLILFYEGAPCQLAITCVRCSAAVNSAMPIILFLSRRNSDRCT